ncbi:YbjN domain-containing protein [Pseudohoeflea coraliihabitans]|uniref:YbjN domain-containing protein n=1 Tax=Pseudohoeflea coraliihabitans TaxID=2860393 RepID=A0ABS6WJH3_9HYPH|nr:YbjN domain-containing protein [Pseudohoeflea sp. DP4N28-3]MBW3096096.1 YbjN domain-containing protein [Pseudohoeflea sp. DP4N28-3]
MNLLQLETERHSNPVDVIEFVAAANDWAFERSGEDELAMTVEGRWTDYNVSFSWMEDWEALHIASAFDLKVPAFRATEVTRLLAQVNAQVLMGHFDYWDEEDVVIFRQSLLLSGGAEPTNRQVEMLLSNGLDSCEAYFQAFQFVVWSGMDAKSAMAAVLFETHGEA